MGLGDKGFLRIANENDRLMVASILFKNGYSIYPVRTRRDGKSFQYLIQYEIRSRDISEEDSDES